MCRQLLQRRLTIAAPVLLAASAFAALATGAQAQNLVARFFDGVCYSRIYAADHLARHPRQRVAHIWFVEDPAMPPDGDRFALRFGFTLTDGGSYTSVAYCAADGRCSTEGDGGRVQFTERGQNLLLSVVDYLIVEGADFSPDLAESDDREFQLFPSNPAECG